MTPGELNKEAEQALYMDVKELKVWVSAQQMIMKLKVLFRDRPICADTLNINDKNTCEIEILKIVFYQ